MNRVDRILEDLRYEVELHGRSGWESVYKTDLQFTLHPEDMEIPIKAHVAQALNDLDWFFLCEKAGYDIPHPKPDESFWLKWFGEKAKPYGTTWNFKLLADTLRRVDGQRKAILYNPISYNNPPCVLCYQFQPLEYGKLDCTVSMRSSDVANVLPQDVLMTWLLLSHVADLVDLEPGNLTFNLGNAHVYYIDLENPRENDIDLPL